MRKFSRDGVNRDEGFRAGIGEKPQNEWSDYARGVAGRKTARRSVRNKSEPDDQRQVVSSKPGKSGHRDVRLERRGARNNFDDLVGDCCLANAVHVQRQTVDQLTRILRRRIHRSHTRALFGRN